MDIFKNRPPDGLDFHVGITVTKGITRGVGDELESLKGKEWIHGANSLSQLFSGGDGIELLLRTLLGGGFNLPIQKTANPCDHLGGSIAIYGKRTGAGQGGDGVMAKGADAEDAKKNGAHA